MAKVSCLLYDDPVMGAFDMVYWSDTWFTGALGQAVNVTESLFLTDTSISSRKLLHFLGNKFYKSLYVGEQSHG